jgi:hypothetical protein
MSLAQKEVTELIKEIKAAGYKVASSGRTHHVVLDKSGRRLTDANGPLIISKTPSEHRWREMTVHRLIAAGVFKVDPKKAGQKADKDGRGSRITDPDVIRKRIEATKAAARDRADLTAKLRSRLEPIIVKLGGWHETSGPAGPGGGVAATELGRAMQHWLTREGITAFPSENAAVQCVNTNLRKGGTVGDKNVPMIEAFISELERQGENVQAWYFKLVRESKGLPPPTRIERDRPLQLLAGDPEETPGGTADEEPEARPLPPSAPPAVAALYAEVPRLTMEALFYMSIGGTEETKDGILNLAERLAKLEMEGSK